MYILIILKKKIRVGHCPPSPSLPPSLLNSNYLTQKLNKNNKKIYNGDCNLAKKKKKKLFYHQITKKSYVIKEAKAKFLQLQ